MVKITVHLLKLYEQTSADVIHQLVHHVWKRAVGRIADGGAEKDQRKSEVGAMSKQTRREEEENVRIERRNDRKQKDAALPYTFVPERHKLRVTNCICNCFPNESDDTNDIDPTRIETYHTK
uniref:Uncharacterized protein n=1 Tax=Romanomermis culicivorax TaxID=13658 RepID=A0A915I0S4_ROMCU